MKKLIYIVVILLLVVTVIGCDTTTSSQTVQTSYKYTGKDENWTVEINMDKDDMTKIIVKYIGKEENPKSIKFSYQTKTNMYHSGVISYSNSLDGYYAETTYKKTNLNKAIIECNNKKYEIDLK